MLLNQRTYETEYTEYTTCIENLTENEIVQIKEQFKNELSNDCSKMETIYTVAVDWSITISLLKYILSL